MPQPTVSYCRIKEKNNNSAICCSTSDQHWHTDAYSLSQVFLQAHYKISLIAIYGYSCVVTIVKLNFYCCYWM